MRIEANLKELSLKLRAEMWKIGGVDRVIYADGRARRRLGATPK